MILLYYQRENFFLLLFLWIMFRHAIIILITVGVRMKKSLLPSSATLAELEKPKLSWAAGVYWCCCSVKLRWVWPLQSQEKSQGTEKNPSIRSLTCCHIWERESASLTHSLKWVLKSVHKADSVLPFLQLLFGDCHQGSGRVAERPWHIL